MKSKEIGCCGLLCFLCSPEGSCGCRTAKNHCGKRLAPGGCFQYNCCTRKGLSGCWECPDAPCGEDMHSQDMVKIRAFVRCIRQDGMSRFLGYIDRNVRLGIMYHRGGITGDYDLDTEEQVLRLLRTGTL